MIITDEILEYNKENNLYTTTNAVWDEVFTYASYYAHTHGMQDIVYLNAFASSCSGIVGGMFVSVGAEMYFREQMEYDIVDMLGTLEFPTDEDKINAIKKIFQFYEQNGSKYEKVIYHHMVRLPNNIYDKLENLRVDEKLDNISDAIRYCIHDLSDNDDLENLTKTIKSDITREVSWYFSYSDERLWEQLKDTHPSWSESLLLSVLVVNQYVKYF